MKKALWLLLVVILGLLGWRWYRQVEETRGELTPGAGPSRDAPPYGDRIRRVGRDLLRPLSDTPTDATSRLQSLYAEGKSLYAQGLIGREQAAQAAQGIQLLQEFNLARQQAQAEYDRLATQSFSTFGDLESAAPEKKRAHFRENQRRLWRDAVIQARPRLKQALAGIP